jgi:carbon monoxide dehydrogenase subunit G
MAQASVSDVVVVAAPVEVVWAVITDPALIPELDPRFTLVTASGEHGCVGSGYVLRASSGPRTVELRYRVVEATPPAGLVLAVTVGGRQTGAQRASLAAQGADTALTWTTTSPTPFGTAPIARRMMRKEMRSWLDAVAALSAART